MSNEMGNINTERKTGCGFLTAIFGRKSKARRVNSTGSIPSSGNNSNVMRRNPSAPNSQSIQVDRIVPRPGPNHYRGSPYHHPHQQQALLVYNNKNDQQQQLAKKTHPPDDHVHDQLSSVARSAQVYGVTKKLPYGATGISGELESMFQDHQKSNRAGSLVRASSSNVMLYGNLGNLRGNVNNLNADTDTGGTGTGTGIGTRKITAAAGEEVITPPNGKYGTSVMGNVVITKQNISDEKPEVKNPAKALLCRALSTRMDPEELKILGNEDYKNGRFAEALSLYEAAISIDPNKASYRSNKSAALTALGRLLEAVFECREAIQIEPLYQRAHSRLATLYLRLGDAEKAMHHYKLAGVEGDPDVVTKAKKLQGHLNKCTEAKMHKDWHTLFTETTFALSSGADSAPQIFALKAEALLKLQRQEEAEEVMQNSPKFSDDECIKFFGHSGYATVLVIRALVHMAAGRFDEAVEAAQLATRLDPNNKEANLTVRKTGAVATARSNGNELFKTGRYSEASIAYGEGLNYDPLNAVLLCNRAACRSKLGQIEKAIDDCNAALTIRPSYKKARLRRADCYFKMQKWEACMRECEALLKESAEDEEARKMLNDAMTKLSAQNERHHNHHPQGKEITSNVNGSGGGGGGGAEHDGVVMVSSNQRFKDYITSKGLSVVLFGKKPWDKQVMQFMEQLQIRYQSVNFLKVEVEDQPSIARSEGVNPSRLPVFKVYKNGSRTKDIPCTNHELLQSTIQLYIS